MLQLLRVKAQLDIVVSIYNLLQINLHKYMMCAHSTSELLANPVRSHSSGFEGGVIRM